MLRRPRIYYLGVIYHVTVKVSGLVKVFESKENEEDYLELISISFR